VGVDIVTIATIIAEMNVSSIIGQLSRRVVAINVTLGLPLHTQVPALRLALVLDPKPLGTPSLWEA
jgi:hypothetical protein